MKKHIRDAIRQAGLRLSDVTVCKTGHYHLSLANGRTVHASGSPTDRHNVVKAIARDLSRAMRSTVKGNSQ